MPQRCSGSAEILPPTMKTLVSLSLLAALLVEGSCLMCEICGSPGEGCTGLAHVCNLNEDACLNIVGMNSLGGRDTMETAKDCVRSGDCYDGFISITTDAGLHLQSISRCCHDDLCNHLELTLPPVNHSSNGLQCPVCFAFGSDHCEGTETLNCTGVDNHCITVSGMLNAAGAPSKFSAKGCGTQMVCSLPLGISLYSAGLIFNLNRITCIPASNAFSGREK